VYILELECLVKLKVDSNILDSIFKALKPETTRLVSRRVSVTLEKTDGSVIFKFNAKDPTALRAALNSYLRWFSAVEKSLKSIEALQFPNK